MWNSRFAAVIVGCILLPFTFTLCLVLTGHLWMNALTGSIESHLLAFAHGGDKKAVQEAIAALGEQIVAGVKEPFAKLQQGQDSDSVQAMQVSKEIDIQNVKLIPANRGTMKVIGSIANHSHHTVRMLHLTVSYLDAAGQLLDVQTKWLSDVKFLPAGQSIDFAVEPEAHYGSNGQPVEQQQPPTSVRVRLADFQLFDLPK